MKVTYQIDQNNNILGWYSSDPLGVELSDVFNNSSDLTDQNGNPLWQLGADGITVTAATQSSIQISPLSTRQSDALMKTLPQILLSLAIGTGTDPLSVACQQTIKGIK